MSACSETSADVPRALAVIMGDVLPSLFCRDGKVVEVEEEVVTLAKVAEDVAEAVVNVAELDEPATPVLR